MKISPGKLALQLLFTLSTLAVAASHGPAGSSVSPDEALARLKKGNHRFVTASVSAGKPTAARRTETAEGQKPFAVVVGCADSRTSPEILFDQNIGDLFVIRTAGSLVDDYALGSIEYAVEHLRTRLIVVLGHQNCGAVKAALAGGEAPGHIHALVGAIEPAVAASKGRSGDPLVNAIHANDDRVAEKIRKKAKLGEFASKVEVVEGYYDLHTGKVEWSK